MIWGKLFMGGERMNNVASLVVAMKKAGFTNPYLQAAILGVVGKESEFIPKGEDCYDGSTPKRIKEIFPSYFGGWSDAQINELKKDCRGFFNKVYGDRGGNNPMSDDGYRYRGRGFNQLTFKDSYESIGRQIGRDLVRNPDLLDRPDIAAEAMIAFFEKSFAPRYSSYIKRYIPSGNANDAQDLMSAVRVAANANAGWGNTPEMAKVKRAIDLTYPIADDALKKYIGQPASQATTYRDVGVLPTPSYLGIDLPKPPRQMVFVLGGIAIVLGTLLLIRTKSKSQTTQVTYQSNPMV